MPADSAQVITAVQQAEPALTAALVALAFTMMEIIKLLINWLGKKYTGKDKHQTLLVQLDPEVSSIVHKTGDEVHGISAVVTRVDADGVPLVYADRKVERSVEKIAETLERISRSQDRLAETMGKLEQRFEMHDRSDAVVFSRLSDTQERIETVASDNRDSLMSISKDHVSVIQKLDKIEEDFINHDRRVMEAVSIQRDILKKVQ